MNKIYLILFLLIMVSFSYAESYQVSYNQYNGDKLTRENAISFLYHNKIAYLSYSDSTEQYFLDFKKEESINFFRTKEDSLFKITSPFSSFGEPKIMGEEENILGFKCKKAIYNSFSNKFEVWFTTDSKIKGSPLMSNFPNNSLVLRVIINGGYRLEAQTIAEVESAFDYNPDLAKEISEAKYEYLKIQSRYTAIPIFEKEQINFSNDYQKNIEELEPGKVYHFSKGNVILKKIKLPKIYSGSFLFLKLTEWSNGDAYDRVGSVFTFKEDKDKITILDALKDSLSLLPKFTANNGKEYQGVVRTENYEPYVELMRFFTPFGVGYFNKRQEIDNYKWQDSIVYKQDITGLIDNDSEDFWIGVFIGNYDKGGHKVSLELDYYPAFEKKEPLNKWIMPLFNTVNVMEAMGQNYGTLFREDTLRTSFTIPENIDSKSLELIFTSTGHGGWGNGDEFNKKLNTIYLDGEKIFNHIPWRTDCGTFRMSNPASGNFANGLSSSDLSRSNWAPGTLTVPFCIPLNDLKAGEHIIEVVIDQGEDEGNSFNSWNVSGVLVGEYLEK